MPCRPGERWNNIFLLEHDIFPRFYDVFPQFYDIFPHFYGIKRLKKNNSQETRQKMKIRPIPFSDELFYWLRMGKQPTVVDVHCTLTKRVVPRALKLL
jgi:hypothetical protein